MVTKLTRQYLEELIFMYGDNARFTQDSPILPDVWIAFGCAPDSAQELLLTPHLEARTAKVASHLREHFKGVEPKPRIAAIRSNICGTFCFETLIQKILPMTTWWCEYGSDLLVNVGKGGTITTTQLAKTLSTYEAGQTQPVSSIKADFLWMLRLVGTIAAAFYGEKKRSKKEGHVFSAKKVVEAFYKLVGNAWESLETLDRQEQIWLINRNREAKDTVKRSTKAIKADAAARLFDIKCHNLAWAIIDSGIDAEHPAFKKSGKKSRIKGTYDFNRIRTLLDPDNLDPSNEDLPEYLRKRLDSDPNTKDQLEDLQRHLTLGREIDWDLLAPFLEVKHDAFYKVPVNDHGTHVAGIMAGGEWDNGGAGVCPDIKLYDFRVLGDDGTGSEFSVIAALQFIDHMNAHRDFKVIHGANLSLSIRHDVNNYACGRTPVCEECDRLVSAGVVVTVAAGNLGYIRYLTDKGELEGYNNISITDPGNAEKVITVGATHRFQPHTYGVSYFSSRGPTGDGRVKPDLVAPGEKITAALPGENYGTKDGTSMAAPHVSGAAALILARYPELIGQPDKIKEILCKTATDLGRERYFQGHGMVDVLRALQSI